MAGYGIVAGGEAGGVDGDSFIRTGDLATAGGPGIHGFFAQVEICGAGSDGEWVAGEDVGGVGGAAELDGEGRVDLAEAKDDAGGEPVGVDVADAAGDLGCVDRTVVDVGVFEVDLGGAEGEAVMEERKNVVEAASTG